jgi:hypothetical protein
MAVTVTPLAGGHRAKRWTVTFALDADITTTIQHGFGEVPDHVEILPLNAQAYTGSVSRGTLTSTSIVINKTAAAGSGGASVELIVYIPRSSL